MNMQCNTASLGGLTDFKRVLYELVKSWGLFFDPTSSCADSASVAPILADAQDILAAAKSYSNSLASFYTILFKNLIFLRKKTDSLTVEKSKLALLIDTLPFNALAVLPFSEKKKSLNKITLQKEIPEEDEVFVIRLIKGTTNDQIDDLMDWMSLKQTGHSLTNFEKLYKHMNDDSLSRILPVVSALKNYLLPGLAMHDNRMYFIFSMTEKWYESYFNPTHIPVNVTPNSEGNNPNGFFELNPDELKEDRSIFTFTGSSILSPDDVYNRYGVHKTYLMENQTYGTSFANNSVRVHTFWDYTFSDFTFLPEKKVVGDRGSIDYDLHFFHPVSVVGLDEDKYTIKIPEKSLLPAFFVKYSQEYEELQVLYTWINLGVNLAVEFGLFFATGGVSFVKNLKYLRNLSKFGRSLRSGIAVSNVEKAVIFKSLEGLTEVAQLSLGIIGSIHIFLIRIDHDSEEKEAADKLGFALMLLSFSLAGMSVALRYAAMRAANKAIIALSALSTSKRFLSAARHQELIEMLSIVKNAPTGLSSGIRHYFDVNLASRGLSEADKFLFLARYDGLTGTDQLTLFKDFINHPNPNALNDLMTGCGGNGKLFDYWKQYNSLDIPGRKNIIGLAEVDIIRIINYYDNTPNFARYLSSFDELARLKVTRFLDEIDDGSTVGSNRINKIKAQPIYLNLLETAEDSVVAANRLSLNDVLEIVDEGLPDLHIDLLCSVNKVDQAVAAKDFMKYVKTPSKERLRNIVYRYETRFPNTPDGIKAWGRFKKDANIMHTSLEYFNNVTGKAVLSNESYISSSGDIINSTLNKGVFSPDFVKPANNKVKALGKKANDVISEDALNAPKGYRPRKFDSEIKFLFNFLENHFHLADEFTIVIESKYIICPSCRQYFMGLSDLAKRKGKTINFEVWAHHDISGNQDYLLKIK
jgi:hypothetical protein